MKGCHWGDFSALLLHHQVEEDSTRGPEWKAGEEWEKQLCVVDCVGRPVAGPVELPDGFKNSGRERIMATLGPLSFCLTCICLRETGKC